MDLIDIDKKFDESVLEVQFLKRKPSDSDLLQLYGLYKHSLFGNNRTPKPSVLNFKDNAKWNSWYSLRGKGKTRAKYEYIKLVDNLKNKYGVKES